MATTSGKKTASSVESSSGRRKRKKVNLFHQRLASLTYHQAGGLLGDDGHRLMRLGNRFTEIDPDDVFLGGDLLRIKVEDCEEKWRGVEDAPDDDRRFHEKVIVTMTRQSTRSKQLQLNCDHCDADCHHVGAALEYLLDAKSVLGLAAPPDETVPLENLTDEELLRRAIAERQQRATEEPMRGKSLDPRHVWSDYVTMSHSVKNNSPTLG